MKNTKKRKLKPGDVWHETATVKIIYEPETKDPYKNEKVLKIYKKEKHD